MINLYKLAQHPLTIGGGSITAIQAIEQLPVDKTVNIITTIIVAIATLIKMFKKDKKN